MTLVDPVTSSDLCDERASEGRAVGSHSESESGAGHEVWLQNASRSYSYSPLFASSALIYWTDGSGSEVAFVIQLVHGSAPGVQRSGFGDCDGGGCGGGAVVGLVIDS